MSTARSVAAILAAASPCGCGLLLGDAFDLRVATDAGDDAVAAGDVNPSSDVTSDASSDRSPSESGASVTGSDDGGGPAPDCSRAPPWAPSVDYQVGDYVTYQGALYLCVAAHTSGSGSEPNAATTLWQTAVCDCACSSQTQTCCNGSTCCGGTTCPESHTTGVASGPSGRPQTFIACSTTAEQIARYACAIYSGDPANCATGLEQGYSACSPTPVVCNFRAAGQACVCWGYGGPYAGSIGVSSSATCTCPTGSAFYF